MNTGFSSNRSAAIREELVRTVGAATRGALTGSARTWASSLGLVVAGMIVGGAVSATAITMAPQNPGIDAFPGQVPGQPVITPLGEVISLEITHSRSVPLLGIPDDATHVRVTVTCVTEGITTWGLDPAGNNPSTACSTEDLNGEGGWHDFALAASASTLYVEIGPGVESRISYRYLDVAETAWDVNDAGDTFGTTKDGVGQPDLTAVNGRDANGRPISGYVRTAELEAFGPDWPHLPSNPEEAIRWQEEREEAYPDGWDIPVYSSDGKTQVGTFHIGN